MLLWRLNRNSERARCGHAVDRTIRANLRRGPSRPRRIRHPPAPAGARLRAPADGDARPARLARSGGGQLLVSGQSARVRLSRRGNGRRHPGELHAARGVPVRQHDDSRDGRARVALIRRQAAAVSRELVHLSTRLSAAHAGGRAPHRAARADQRAVRARQNCGHQVVSELPPAIRMRLHRGDADQPVRSLRQFRSRQLARRAGHDAKVSSGQGRGTRRRGHLGHRHAAQ